jgi:hypothetical protein
MNDAPRIHIDVRVDPCNPRRGVLTELVVALRSMERVVEQRGQADFKAGARESSQENVVVRCEVNKTDAWMPEELLRVKAPEIRFDLKRRVVKDADQVVEE